MASTPRKKRESRVPANETNAAKFVRLAGARGGTAKDAIEALGTLANTRTYEYNQAQVNSLFKALQTALDQTKAKFSGENASASRPKTVLQL